MSSLYCFISAKLEKIKKVEKLNQSLKLNFINNNEVVMSTLLRTMFCVLLGASLGWLVSWWISRYGCKKSLEADEKPNSDLTQLPLANNLASTIRTKLRRFKTKLSKPAVSKTEG